ncbi:MAG TPA: FMN-binding protein [Anaerohalosphaeraceae bacterium]|nr:FMN-binding protein [Anaerohalosphaeraceae bacterium]
MSKLRFFWEQSWLLLVSSLVFGVLLAIADTAWAPRIARNEVEKFTRLAGGMLPEAKRFEAVEFKIPVDAGKGKTVQIEVYRAVDDSGKRIGWAFVCEGSGFADKIKLVVAADAGFEKLAGFGVLSSNETPGFGDKITIPGGFYQKQFVGAPAGTLTLVKTGDAERIDGEIVAISGATVTSQAVVDILNRYVSAVRAALREQGLLTKE